MKNLKNIFLLVLVAFSFSAATMQKAYAGTTSVSWGSVPSQVTVGKTGSYKFTVSGSGTISHGSCILSAYFPPIGTQSKAALEGSGSASGKSISTDYGSAGMSAIAFSGTINLPATFTMNFKNSSEVKPSSTGKITVSYVMSCDSHVTSTKNVNIVGACYGKTCGCGSLPACKPKATATPKVTATTPATTATPTTSVTASPSMYVVTVGGVNVGSLAALTVDKRTNMENFTVESEGKNKMVFSGKISLLDAAKLKDFDSYVSLSETGKVSIDSEKMPELNVPAVITMKGLTFKMTPVVLRNGQNAGDSVKNVKYDAATGTLTFEVTGFSTYTAEMSIGELELPVYNTNYWPYIIAGIGVLGIGAFVAMKYMPKAKVKKSAK